MDSYDGTLSSLQGRLSTLPHSVAVQEELLAQTRSQATAARHRLHLLEADLRGTSSYSPSSSSTSTSRRRRRSSG